LLIPRLENCWRKSKFKEMTGWMVMGNRTAEIKIVDTSVFSDVKI
jgi:hypothetical protein